MGRFLATISGWSSERKRTSKAACAARVGLRKSFNPGFGWPSDASAGTTPAQRTPVIMPERRLPRAERSQSTTPLSREAVRQHRVLLGDLARNVVAGLVR